MSEIRVCKCGDNEQAHQLPADPKVKEEDMLVESVEPGHDILRPPRGGCGMCSCEKYEPADDSRAAFFERGRIAGLLINAADAESHKQELEEAKVKIARLIEAGDDLMGNVVEELGENNEHVVAWEAAK